MNTIELPLPAFYDPASAERWGHAPDQGALFTAADRVAQGARPQARRGRQAERPPPPHRRAERLLLPPGLALRRRPERARRRRRQPPHRRVRLQEPGRDHRHHHHHGHALRVPDFFASFWVTGDDQPVAAHREITTAPDRRGRGAAQPRGGEVALRRQLPLAPRAGALLLRGAGEGGQVPALPLAAPLHARQRRARARRRRARGPHVPLLRPRRAVVGRGQGRQPAHRELLGDAARGAGAP